MRPTLRRERLNRSWGKIPGHEFKGEAVPAGVPPGWPGTFWAYFV